VKQQGARHCGQRPLTADLDPKLVDLVLKVVVQKDPVPPGLDFSGMVPYVRRGAEHARRQLPHVLEGLAVPPVK
jgi:hypothetical protein